MSEVAYHQYITHEGAALFTVIALPHKTGAFPTVIMRTPYAGVRASDEEAVQRYLKGTAAMWLSHGYAFVLQHCRGTGKSSGDCVPYIHEREDGLFLQEWVRQQDFYNGELYLHGASYGTSVHLVTAPFAPDIKGAIFECQDSERYNCNYRNGFYKIGLHGKWYVKMYKKKSILRKNYVPEVFQTLPLSAFSRTVFGEPSADFDEILRHPDKNDPFWQTRFGGGEAHDAIRHANIPILLLTGQYDIYTGGVHDMWQNMDADTKAKSVLLVHPYGHSGLPEGQPITFPNGTVKEAFGEDYRQRWLDFVRGCDKSPWELGKVTYYRCFDDTWCTDDFAQPDTALSFTLGEGERTYRYNPAAPATFQGGLCTNFGGTAYQDKPNSRYDIISLYTPAFDEDVRIKGEMKARLCVRSTAEDTCFYVRVSLAREEGDIGLRDDINQISNFNENYVPGDTLYMDFCFDEHAFLIRKGERLRVDISSSALPLYVTHTNNRGLFSEQTAAKIADNTVVLERSSLTVYTE